MSRNYNGNQLVYIEDLKQLCSRVDQTLEQFIVAEKTTSILVSHFKDDKLVFSSLERFRLYESSKSKPVFSLIVTFNFLIHVPGTGKHYNYKLVVDVTPFVLNEHKEIMDQYSIPFYRLNGPPIKAVVEYVDYVVARSLLSSVDDWISGLKSISQPKFSRWLKDRQDTINTVLPLTAILVAIFTASTFIPDFSGDGSSNMKSFALWMCGSVAWVFVLYVVFELLNKAFHHHVLDLRSATFVMFNRGDEANKEEVEKKLRGNNWVITAIILAGALNIACSLAADRIINAIGWQ